MEQGLFVHHFRQVNVVEVRAETGRELLEGVRQEGWQGPGAASWGLSPDVPSPPPCALPQLSLTVGMLQVQ